MTGTSFKLKKQSSLSALLLLAFSASVFAAGPVAPPIDAGRVLNNVQTEPVLQQNLDKNVDDLVRQQKQKQEISAALKDLQIEVKTVRITGNTVFSEAVLLDQITSVIGKKVAFSQLQNEIDKIARYYQERGYLLARAYLPPQEVVGGGLQVVVVEGYLNAINLNNQSRVSDKVVKAYLDHIQTGSAVQSSDLERNLLLLNDLPGTEVQSTLKPGPKQGTSDLDIAVNDTQRVVGNITFDNYGNRFIGEYRLGANINVNSPFKLGDLATVNLLTGGGGFKYARLGYQAPVGGSGLTVGGSWAEMRYKLLKDFSHLRAEGSSHNGTLYALYPIVRKRNRNINFQFNYDHKELKDVQDAIPDVRKRNINVFNTGLGGDFIDGFLGGGLNKWGVNWVHGNLDLDTTNIPSPDPYHTVGSYNKFMVNLSRSHRLTDRLRLYGQVRWQTANKNLDSSEKMSMGGASDVQAYPEGEGAINNGWLANVELHYFPRSNLQLLAFYNYGNGDIYDAPLPTDTNNHRVLRGVGVGFVLHQAVWMVQGSVAWRLSDEPTADVDRHPRFWIQGVRYF